MSIVIKKLTRADWQIFKELRLQMLIEEPHAFTTTYEQVSEYSETEWKNRTASDKAGILVIFVDDKPAGMNGFYYKDEKDKVTIWGMFVKKEFRERGFGKKLMDAIEKEIRKDKAVKKINICVMTSQIPAWELYKKQGFVEVARDEKKKQFNDGWCAEVHMEKTI